MLTINVSFLVEVITKQEQLVLVSCVTTKITPYYQYMFIEPIRLSLAYNSYTHQGAQWIRFGMFVPNMHVNILLIKLFVGNETTRIYYTKRF